MSDSSPASGQARPDSWISTPMASRACILLLCVATYWILIPRLGFYLDDYPKVWHVQTTRIFEAFKYWTLHIYKEWGRITVLPTLVTLVSLKAFGPLNAPATLMVFHLLHLANIFLFLSLARRMGASPLLAWLAASFFAIFPLRSMAVFWITGISAVTLLAFCLLSSSLSFSIYRTAGKQRWLWLGTALFVTAFFCYETTVAIGPLVLVAPMLAQPAMDRAQWKRLGACAAPVILATLAFLVAKLFLMPRGDYLTVGPHLNLANFSNCISDLCGSMAVRHTRLFLDAFRTQAPQGYAMAGGAALVLGALASWILTCRRPAAPKPDRGLVCLSGLGLGVLIVCLNYAPFALVSEPYTCSHHNYVASLGLSLALASALAWVHGRTRFSALFKLASRLVIAGMIGFAILLNLADGLSWVEVESLQKRAMQEVKDQVPASANWRLILFEGFPVHVGSCPTVFGRAAQHGLWTQSRKRLSARTELPARSELGIDGLSEVSADNSTPLDKTYLFALRDWKPVQMAGIRYWEESGQPLEVPMPGPSQGLNYCDMTPPYRWTDRLPEDPSLVRTEAHYGGTLRLLGLSLSKPTDCEIRASLYWEVLEGIQDDLDFKISLDHTLHPRSLRWVSPESDKGEAFRRISGAILVQTVSWKTLYWDDLTGPAPDGVYRVRLKVSRNGQTVPPETSGPGLSTKRDRLAVLAEVF